MYECLHLSWRDDLRLTNNKSSFYCYLRYFFFGWSHFTRCWHKLADGVQWKHSTEKQPEDQNWKEKKRETRMRNMSYEKKNIFFFVDILSKAALIE